MKDLISIVVPCYNVSRYLNDFFAAIENISYSNYEVILVDDGSTDETGSILDKFASTHNFAKVFHQRNAGLSAARNSGIKIAKGKYIMFFDPDDYFHPDILSVLYSIITKTNADVSACNYKRVKESSHYDIAYKKPKIGKIRFSNGKDDSMVMFLLISINAVWVRLYKREILEQMPGFPNLFKTVKCWEDGLFNLSYLSYAHSFAYAKAKLYFYRNRKSSLSYTQAKMINTGFYMVRDFLNSLDKSVYQKSQIYINTWLCLASMFVMNKIFHCPNYHNPEFARFVYKEYCDKLPYLIKTKHLWPPRRYGTMFTKPFMYLMMRKKMKD